MRLRVGVPELASWFGRARNAYTNGLLRSAADLPHTELRQPDLPRVTQLLDRPNHRLRIHLGLGRNPGAAAEVVVGRLEAVANAVALTGWIAQVRAADLPFMHSYATGLERDRAAVDAALTLPWHNGRTEGVNNKIKLIKRQTYGRAGHPLLRQRILLS